MTVQTLSPRATFVDDQLLHYGKLTLVRHFASSRHPIPLFNSLEVKPLLTPFRFQIVADLYRTVQELLGLSRPPFIDISIWSQPGEDAPPVLLVTVYVPRDQSAIRDAKSKVLAQVAEWARAWNEAQKDDYRTHIFFDIEPTPP